MKSEREIELERLRQEVIAAVMMDESIALSAEPYFEGRRRNG